MIDYLAYPIKGYILTDISRDGMLDGLNFSLIKDLTYKTTKNIIVGGYDQVAVDSVVSKLMGFDPLKIKKLRIAEEFSLGVANPKNIKVVGENISKINWNYSSNENTFASKGQKFIYWGPLKPLEKILLRSKISPWAFFASDLYHNKYWLRFIGKRRIKKAMKTSWGRLFQKY